MNKKLLTALSLSAAAVGVMAADAEQVDVNLSPVTINPVSVKSIAPTGTIRPLRSNPTSPYDASRVETKLNVDIKDSTDAVHFIRDNSDPYIVTKAYRIKNADPFILRGVLKYTVSAGVDGTPVALESLEYQDGSGVLLVSAEEYRFKDAGNGMTMDQLVAALDKKDLPNSSGTIDMAYFPKYNNADTLLQMMKESGIGMTGAVPTSKSSTYDENGLHVPNDFLNYAAVDEGMNAIIMTGPGYDMDEALRFLAEVDTPCPEMNITFKLVEIYAENDQKLGVDFQSWKNNDGVDLFSVGGKFGRNDWSGVLMPNGGRPSLEYYNFNPKWNTKYIDFLTTCGKAKIVSTGTLVVANGLGSNLIISDDLFKIAIEKIKNEKTVMDVMPSAEGKDGGWYIDRFNEILNNENKIGELLKTIGVVEQGNTQEVQEGGSHCFSLAVACQAMGAASVMKVGMTSTSVIGWTGDGSPRLTTSHYETTFQVGAKKDFVVGGITKSSVVRSVSGVPFLKDLPILGWVFSTESDTVKNSQYVLIANVEPRVPSDGLKPEVQKTIDDVRTKVDEAVQHPMATAGFQQLWLDDNGDDAAAEPAEQAPAEQAPAK